MKTKASFFYFRTVFRYGFLILVLIFIFNKLKAQDNHIVLTGQVIDSLSGKSIEGVHISSKESQIGVITDEKGYFKLTFPETSVLLKISSIAYTTKHCLINSKEDSILIIKLSPKTYSLEEVSINTNTYNKHQSRYSVLDYEFKGDSILVLQKKRSNRGYPSLVVLDWKFDTLMLKKKLPKDISKIFKDCLNSLHLVSNDSVYQIIFDGDSLNLYPPYERVWFDRIMGNCLFRKDGEIYFEISTYRGYGHEIISINEETKEKKLFVRYVDKQHLSRMKESISHISSYYFMHNIVNAATNDSAAVHHITFYDDESRFIKEIGDKPIENKICLNNDTISYLNYYESKIHNFTKHDQPLTEISIDYNPELGWGSQIIVDDNENIVYSIVKDRTSFKIFSINSQKGVTNFKTKLSVFDGNNLKVNNGYLYYLENRSKSNFHVRKLSRMKL